MASYIPDTSVKTLETLRVGQRNIFLVRAWKYLQLINRQEGIATDIKFFSLHQFSHPR